MPKAINAARLPLPQLLADALARKVAAIAPAISRTVVIELGGMGSHGGPEPDVQTMLRRVFDGYDWMDPSVLEMATYAAHLSARVDRQLMKLARDLEPDKAQILRRLASGYRMPRGIIIRENKGYRALSYREIFAMIAGEPTAAQLVLLGWTD